MQHRQHWPPQTRPAARTATLGRRVSLAQPQPTSSTLTPPSSPHSLSGGVTARPLSPRPETRGAPPPLPSPGAHPHPVGAALGTHSLGPLASPAPQPGASAALRSLIKEGGSGVLNLCLPLQSGCNSTPPALTPHTPPRTLTHTHTS